MKDMLSADAIRITITESSFPLLLRMRVAFLKGNDEMFWVERDIGMGDSLDVKDLKIKIPIKVEA